MLDRLIFRTRRVRNALAELAAESKQMDVEMLLNRYELLALELLEAVMEMRAVLIDKKPR